MGKIQKAQDAAREYTVRQELGGELHDNEIDRQRDGLEGDQHQRALAAKRRTQELVNVDTEILLARQTLRAKKKFEPLKHAIGEERFKTEAARRQVGAAEARMAISEASTPEAQPQAEAPGTTAEKADSRAAVVSGLLEGVRSRLREMRADGEDTDERAQLVDAGSPWWRGPYRRVLLPARRPFGKDAAIRIAGTRMRVVLALLSMKVRTVVVAAAILGAKTLL
jgi:hypothetical protein